VCVVMWSMYFVVWIFEFYGQGSASECGWVSVGMSRGSGGQCVSFYLLDPDHGTRRHPENRQEVGTLF
jgi:hypothetical protein